MSPFPPFEAGPHVLREWVREARPLSADRENEVRPRLLGNEECPHYFSGGRRSDACPNAYRQPFGVRTYVSVNHSL